MNHVFYIDGKDRWRSKAGGVCQMPLFIKLSGEIAWWLVRRSSPWLAGRLGLLAVDGVGILEDREEEPA
jgi:hypothetical protein